jgi:hypothetical protein
VNLLIESIAAIAAKGRTPGNLVGFCVLVFHMIEPLRAVSCFYRGLT